ncbi:MAG: class I SAM-dependent methyltransferase [Methanoregula sp.]|nr:class I SAM-dependent methyltransferase [Methanoregula sp.]
MNQEEPKSNPDVILRELKNNFRVIDILIELKDFKKFCDTVGYPRSYGRLFGNFLNEKLLEHYISTILLDFSVNDRFIDIAASHSHYAEYIHKKGIESYKQDLIFPKGITVSRDSDVPLIGGSAANLPFRDNYFTRMTLHCSIEHFEYVDDINYINEASRVLQPKSKICILPLYFGEEYHIVTDPKIFEKEKNEIRFEENVPIYFKKGFGNRHCRVYSVSEFKNRLADDKIWQVEIFHVLNLNDIGKELYCEFAALFIKK